MLIVDDHDIVREGLRRLFEKDEEVLVVGEASSVGEAVRRVAIDTPDVVVLDLRLGDGSGIEACRRIHAWSPDIKVLILTAYADDQAVTEAIKAGASGYLLKRARLDSLVDAVHRAALGQTVFEHLPANSQDAIDRDPLIKLLTPRERDILELVAEGKTNREIAESMFLAEKTVKNYVSNILAKMGIRHRAGAAAYLVSRKPNGSAYPPEEWVN
ncbi:MAG TPA: response regulator transcription factor [Acidimicrobiia bacterium]|nr:response regulator transcription factor [Acidimicrobiia bacterium]